MIIARIKPALIIAAPLAILFWMSGAVAPWSAAAAMVIVALVVLAAGTLCLRAARAMDLGVSAAWVLGVFATALALYALVMVFDLLAATAFAIWAGCVLAASVVFRPPIPRPEYVALALCGAATLYWCSSVAPVPEILARDGVLTTWVDQFIHGAVISQFGDPRAAGRGAIELVDLPRPLYHYASYLLPAALAWPLDLPGLPLATSVWVPIGFLTLCAGAYVLGATLSAPRGGVLALAVLTLLPDAASYGLHNLFFAYHYYMLNVPGGTYGVGICLVAIALMRQSLPGSAALVAGTFLVRAHLVVLTLPAWIATALILRRRFAFLAATAAAFVAFVFGFYAARPDAVPALPEFLHVIHHHASHLNQPVYHAWYAQWTADHGAMAGFIVGVLLVLPAAFGVLLVLYPLSVYLAHRVRALGAFDVVPVVLLVCYLLLVLCAPIPRDDPTELAQRPFVLVYAVLAIWTAAGFARWAAAHGGLQSRRVRFAALLILPLWILAATFWTVADPRWRTVLKWQQVAPGLPSAANFVRERSSPGDVLAVPALWRGKTYTDAAVQLVSLTGVPAYIARPQIQENRGGRARDAALERYAALARISNESDVRRLDIRWFVLTEGRGPQWDPERKRAAFTAGQTSVYDLRVQ